MTSISQRKIRRNSFEFHHFNLAKQRIIFLNIFNKLWGYHNYPPFSGVRIAQLHAVTRSNQPRYLKLHDLYLHLIVFRFKSADPSGQDVQNLLQIFNFVFLPFFLPKFLIPRGEVYLPPYLPWKTPTTRREALLKWPI